MNFQLVGNVACSIIDFLCTDLFTRSSVSWDIWVISFLVFAIYQVSTKSHSEVFTKEEKISMYKAINQVNHY